MVIQWAWHVPTDLRRSFSQYRSSTFCKIVCSTRFPYYWAGSELTLSIMDGKPHVFHNLPLPSQFLHHYQFILLGDRGIRVWTTCQRLPCSSAQEGVEPVTSRPLSQRSTHSTTASPNVCSGTTTGNVGLFLVMQHFSWGNFECTSDATCVSTRI